MNMNMHLKYCWNKMCMLCVRRVPIIRNVLRVEIFCSTSTQTYFLPWSLFKVNVNGWKVTVHWFIDKRQWKCFFPEYVENCEWLFFMIIHQIYICVNAKQFKEKKISLDDFFVAVLRFVYYVWFDRADLIIPLN